VQLKTPSPLNILVIEVNRIAADMLAALLQMDGYEDQAVYDRRYALDAACRFRPDVIILDISLPDMDGYVAARAFLDDSRIDRARIIAVAGYDQDAVAGRPQRITPRRLKAVRFHHGRTAHTSVWTAWTMGGGRSCRFSMTSSNSGGLCRCLPAHFRPLALLIFRKCRSKMDLRKQARGCNSRRLHFLCHKYPY
jgi:CheY-like chemotaxis protein